MRDRDYYPGGSYYDSSAPFNEVSNPERDFDVLCSQTLSKSVTVTTDEYHLFVEEDEDGKYNNYDTSEVNWSEVYSENDYHTPAQLLSLFHRYLQDELEKPGIAVRNPSFMKRLMRECEDWIVDEEEFVEE